MLVLKNTITEANKNPVTEQTRIYIIIIIIII
jgi:hypothetical protein